MIRCIAYGLIFGVAFIFPKDIAYAQQLVISADKMNVVYIGIDNPLTITAETCGCEDISASCDNGKITKVSGCHFIFRPEKIGPTDIEVAQKTKKGIKKIGVAHYRVKTIPTLQVSLAEQSSGFIDAKKFKAQKGLSIMYVNSELECTWKILEYRVAIFYKMGDVLEIKNSGPLFNAEVIAGIERLKAGDRVIFENIKSIDSDGTIRSINSMTFNVI